MMGRRYRPCRPDGAARNFESGNRRSLPAPFRLVLQYRTLCRLTNVLLYFLLFHMSIRGDRKIDGCSYLAFDPIHSKRAPVREVIEVRELLHAVEGSQLFFVKYATSTLVLPKQFGRDRIETCGVGILAGCEDRKQGGSPDQSCSFLALGAAWVHTLREFQVTIIVARDEDWFVREFAV